MRALLSLCLLLTPLVLSAQSVASPNPGLAGDAGLAYFQSGDVAFIADTQWNQVVRIPYVLTLPNARVLADSEQHISTAIAHDAVNQLVLLGNTGNSELGLLSPWSGTIAYVGGDRPGLLSPIGKKVYEIAASPLVLDTNSSSLRVLFVPAID